MNNAMGGIEKLKEHVDTLIVIPNDKLLEIVDRRTTMPDALRKADEVLQQGIQGITDLINVPSMINLDFADIQTVMSDKGIGTKSEQTASTSKIPSDLYVDMMFHRRAKCLPSSFLVK